MKTKPHIRKANGLWCVCASRLNRLGFPARPIIMARGIRQAWKAYENKQAELNKRRQS